MIACLRFFPFNFIFSDKKEYWLMMGQGALKAHSTNEKEVSKKLKEKKFENNNNDTMSPDSKIIAALQEQLSIKVRY